MAALSLVMVRPVISRMEPSRRSRWLLAGFSAALLHMALLIVIMIIPSRITLTDPEQAAQVMMLLAEPEAPAAAASASAATADIIEPLSPEPVPSPAADPVKEAGSPPPVLPPVAALAEPAPAVSPPPAATEPVMEAAPPPPVPTPLAVPAEPPGVAAVRPEPHVTAVRPRAVTRSATAEKKSAPPPPVGSPERSTPGQGADALQPYRNSLASHVKAFQRYPALARARRQEGLVVVHVTVERDGHIIAMAVEQGSGSALLDHEALATLQRAEPMPVVPSAIPGAVVNLMFPLRFALE